MIEHFRLVQMELLGSSSAVYSRHLVSEMAMGITLVSKALLQDVQQWEANQQAKAKAVKDERCEQERIAKTKTTSDESAAIVSR